MTYHPLKVLKPFTTLHATLANQITACCVVSQALSLFPFSSYSSHFLSAIVDSRLSHVQERAWTEASSTPPLIAGTWDNTTVHIFQNGQRALNSSAGDLSIYLLKFLSGNSHILK